MPCQAGPQKSRYERVMGYFIDDFPQGPSGPNLSNHTTLDALWPSLIIFLSDFS